MHPGRPHVLVKVIGASRLFLLIILNSHSKLTDFKFLIKSNQFVGDETSCGTRWRGSV